jgi:hypothetical protein
MNEASDRQEKRPEKDGAGSEGTNSLNLLALSAEGKSTERVYCKERDDSKLLSMVGPILSFEEHSTGDCTREAHPDGKTSWHAVDLRRFDPDFALGNGVDAGKPAKLTDYFPADSVRDALLKDSVVQKALSTINVQARDIKSLDELMSYIGTGLVYSDDANSDTSSTRNPLCFSMEKDLLSNFAFDHIEGNKVAVRIGLSGAGTCRENLTQIGILLPIPPALKNALGDANSGKGGFLMKDAGAPGSKTSFEWNYSF